MTRSRRHRTIGATVMAAAIWLGGTSPAAASPVEASPALVEGKGQGDGVDVILLTDTRSDRVYRKTPTTATRGDADKARMDDHPAKTPTPPRDKGDNAPDRRPVLRGPATPSG